MSSVSQAVPAKAYQCSVRNVNSTTNNGIFFFTDDAVNTERSQLATSTNVLNLGTSGYRNYYSILSWSYGSGDLVTPESTSILFCIKYE